MVTPNAACSAYCTWLLNSSYYRWSTTRQILINDIKTAADTVTPVTDSDYNQFIQITFPLYQQYINYLAFKV